MAVSKYVLVCADGILQESSSVASAGQGSGSPRDMLLDTPARVRQNRTPVPLDLVRGTAALTGSGEAHLCVMTAPLKYSWNCWQASW